MLSLGKLHKLKIVLASAVVLMTPRCMFLQSQMRTSLNKIEEYVKNKTNKKKTEVLVPRADRAKLSDYTVTVSEVLACAQ